MTTAFLQLQDIGGPEAFIFQRDTAAVGGGHDPKFDTLLLVEPLSLGFDNSQEVQVDIA